MIMSITTKTITYSTNYIISRAVWYIRVEPYLVALKYRKKVNGILIEPFLLKIYMRDISRYNRKASGDSSGLTCSVGLTKVLRVYIMANGTQLPIA